MSWSGTNIEVLLDGTPVTGVFAGSIGGPSLAVDFIDLGFHSGVILAIILQQYDVFNE